MNVSKVLKTTFVRKGQKSFDLFIYIVAASYGLLAVKKLYIVRIFKWGWHYIKRKPLKSEAAKKFFKTEMLLRVKNKG